MDGTLRHYLGLDAAPRHIGWAIGSPRMIKPLCGVYEPPAGNLGAVRDFIDATIKTYHIHTVAYEHPFFMAAAAQYAASAHEMIGVIKLVCEDHEITPHGVAPAEWRSHFLGLTCAPKTIPRPHRRKWLKRECIRVCIARGWPVESDDEADAAGILDWIIAQRDDAYREKHAKRPSLELSEGAA